MACRRIDQDRAVIYCWFFCEVTVLCLVGVCLWLSLTPRNPCFLISAAHLPPSNSTGNRTAAASLFVHLRIFNPNNHMGIDYSSIGLKLYFNGGVVAADSTSAFHQGYKNTTCLHMLISASKEFWKAMNSSSNMDFTLRLETAFSFRIIKWRTKVRHLEREERFSEACIRSQRDCFSLKLKQSSL